MTINLTLWLHFLIRTNTESRDTCTLSILDGEIHHVLIKICIGFLTGLNVVFRKMAGAAKPVIEIKIENDTVNIVSKVSFFNQVISFKLDEPYQQNYEGLEMNVRKQILRIFICVIRSSAKRFRKLTWKKYSLLKFEWFYISKSCFLICIMPLSAIPHSSVGFSNCWRIAWNAKTRADS